MQFGDEAAEADLFDKFLCIFEKMSIIVQDGARAAERQCLANILTFMWKCLQLGK